MSYCGGGESLSVGWFESSQWRTRYVRTPELDLPAHRGDAKSVHHVATVIQSASRGRLSHPRSVATRSAPRRSPFGCVRLIRRSVNSWAKQYSWEPESPRFVARPATIARRFQRRTEAHVLVVVRVAPEPEADTVPFVERSPRAAFIPAPEEPPVLTNPVEAATPPCYRSCLDARIREDPCPADGGVILINGLLSARHRDFLLLRLV